MSRSRHRNNYILNARHVQNRSALLVATGLLLFSLNFQTDNGRMDYGFVQYMKCTETLVEMDEELCCV